MTLPEQHTDRLLGKPLALSELREALNQDEVYECWIAAGQSNMAGGDTNPYPAVLTSEAPFPLFDILDNDGTVIPGNFPFHRANPAPVADNYLDHGTSMATGFCRLRRVYGGAKKVLMVGAAMGGTALHWDANGHWYGPGMASSGAPDDTGGSFYREVRDRINAAIASGVRIHLRGVLWHQGENDAVSIATADYVEAFQSMINGWKTEINDDYFGSHEHMIVLIGQLGQKLLNDGWGSGPTPIVQPEDYQNIDTAHRQLAQENRRYRFVSSEGLTFDDSATNPPYQNIHFDQPSIHEFSRRLLAASVHAEMDIYGDTRGQRAPIEQFSSTVDYPEGDVVARFGTLYRSTVKVAAGAFDDAQWVPIGTNAQSLAHAIKNSDYTYSSELSNNLLASLSHGRLRSLSNGVNLLTEMDFWDQYGLFVGGDSQRAFAVYKKLTAVGSGDTVQFDMQLQATGEEKQNGTGSKTIFALTEIEIPDFLLTNGGSNFYVYVDGVRQYAPADFQTAGTGTVAFTVAPPSGTDNVVFRRNTCNASMYAQRADGLYGGGFGSWTVAAHQATLLYGDGTGKNWGLKVEQDQSNSDLDIASELSSKDTVDIWADSLVGSGRTTVRVMPDKIEFYENGSSGSDGTQIFEMSSAGLESMQNGEGMILRSPNGTRYKVTVTNAGALITTAL